MLTLYAVQQNLKIVKQYLNKSSGDHVLRKLLAFIVLMFCKESKTVLIKMRLYLLPY